MKRTRCFGLRVLVLTMLSAVMLTGCGLDVYKLPLPGGPDAGDDPMTIKVEFADVLDLVPKSTVKVNDVSVGMISDVSLKGYSAVVTLELRRDTKLPANATAEIRQTSLLGEKFVSLSAPEDGASTTLLKDGDVIPLERTGRNPEVEEVLGALSLVLNGGGVAQLQTITRELNKALEGREGAARSVLNQISDFMGQLDKNKADIVTAIEKLNRLAIGIREEQPTIDKTLDELPSALDSIDRQRDDLVKMLQALNDLSDVGVKVIRASKQSTIDTLKALNPVLTQFAESGDNFVNAFHVFLTYPFVDDVVGRDPQVARNLHMGDFTNLSIQLEIDLNVLPSLPTKLPTTLPTSLPTEACIPLSQLPQDGPLPDTSKLCKGVIDAINECLAGIGKGDLNNCIGLPGSVLNTVCEQVGVPVPGLCNANGNPLPTPSIPAVPLPPITVPTVPLPTGTGLPLPLPRAGAMRPPSKGGPTMGELMDAYDPALVSLLVPGMVVK